MISYLKVGSPELYSLKICTRLEPIILEMAEIPFKKPRIQVDREECTNGVNIAPIAFRLRMLQRIPIYL